MKLRVLQPVDPEFINNAFRYHAPTPEQVERYNKIRPFGGRLADVILTMCPPSPERTLAIRKIQEAVMWANASIALTEDYSQEE